MAEPVLTRNALLKGPKCGLMLGCLATILEYDRFLRHLRTTPGSPGGPSVQLGAEAERIQADAEAELRRLEQLKEELTRSMAEKEEEIRRKEELLSTLCVLIAQRISTLSPSADRRELRELEEKRSEYRRLVSEAVGQLRENISGMRELVGQYEQQQAEVRTQLTDTLEQLRRELESNRPAPAAEPPDRALEELKEKLPPPLMNSTLAALDSYTLSTLRGTRRFLLQCVVGEVSAPLCEDAAERLSPLYPSLIRGGRAVLPYVLDRNYGIYQVFCFHQRDADRVWQELGSLCCAEQLLHNQFQLEFTLFDPTGVHGALPDCPCSCLRTAGELSALLGQVEEECSALDRVCLGRTYRSIWEYQLAHPREQLRHRCIVLWSAPDGLEQPLLEQLLNLYDLAERCGVLFLICVNLDSDRNASLGACLAQLTDSLNPLHYQAEEDVFRDVNASNVCFRITAPNREF